MPCLFGGSCREQKKPFSVGEAFSVAAANKAAVMDRAGIAKTADAKVEAARVERRAKRSQSGKMKKIDPGGASAKE